MTRSMMQTYVKGSLLAVELYKKALGATIVDAHPLQEGEGYYHCELDVYGQILAVAELQEPAAITGNVMQFCLHFAPGDEAIVEKAYAALKEGGQVLHPLGPTDFSELMTDLIDPYGVRWCIFVA